MEFLIITFIFFMTVLWFCALIDLSRTPFQNPYVKTVYLLMIVLFPILGSVLYFQSKRFVRGGRRVFAPEFR